ncbi:streptomycin biosynthesis protein StrI [Saccharata proteae CBS 121410]|uniref:Streptomycin biosynthesis protein StrI n=1 Tax=Saccharata proteae CBS 121410 TaxID=1314787 RepID=A0A9P4HQI0_9PEZI|nr:streptomycin biosynthesis protein StrI [Saccharata proteae CBS 121410]
MHTSPPTVPHILIIGAGSRGTAYAAAITAHTSAVIDAVAEPVGLKRRNLARNHIYTHAERREGQEFGGWRGFVEWEVGRRRRGAAGGVDAAFVCVLDEMHREVVEGLGPLGLSVMCEKPLATTLADCVAIYKTVRKGRGERVFGIGHVLRYSPHNMLLRELVRERGSVGEVLSVEHTEPVGWWHFTHSFFRGNWRKESKTAPSLLTKSCHDIDFLLWMLSEPALEGEKIHRPAYLTSTGNLNFYRKARKPAAAGNATNCLACPVEKDCMFSAKKIYVDRHLRKGNAAWPVNIVNPEIEDCVEDLGLARAEEKLLGSLSEDYSPDTPPEKVGARPWFGRCVWEADNDVCDDQSVTIAWEDDPIDGKLDGRGAKTAQFHMVAFTEKQCERRGRIYGTKGEIEYDSSTIRVHDFATGKTTTHFPELRGGGHGGGDDGLATQFVRAVEAVKKGEMRADEAQKRFIGCSFEEILQSHAMVFAAEEARRERKVVDWPSFWEEKVARVVDT